jgi:hypothetical protein
MAAMVASVIGFIGVSPACLSDRALAAFPLYPAAACQIVTGAGSFCDADRQLRGSAR